MVLPITRLCADISRAVPVFFFNFFFIVFFDKLYSIFGGGNPFLVFRHYFFQQESDCSQHTYHLRDSKKVVFTLEYIRKHIVGIKDYGLFVILRVGTESGVIGEVQSRVPSFASGPKLDHS